ncbi:unnamed protein product [Linum tenue]|uniref:Uncharacterized protein n=1 Tax=Linum tenue TaxID=586396 RepID=A0AAV0L371_9ROSI|nr:unnamed protein product [Linum tenue]
MSMVAGLPKFVVLKSKSDGKYLCTTNWNDDSFGPYVNGLGSKRHLDPAQPVREAGGRPVRIRPGTGDLPPLLPATTTISCSLENKYGVSWMSATTNGPGREHGPGPPPPSSGPSSRRASPTRSDSCTLDQVPRVDILQPGLQRRHQWGR